MKRLILICSIAVLAISCNSKSKNNETKENTEVNSFFTADSAITYVYYFHGKQRCKTCITVGNLAQRTVEEIFSNNDKIKFIEVNTTNEFYKELVNKYEVSWNALIVAEENNATDITEQAFILAQTAPEDLVDLIKETVNGKQSIK